MKPSDWMHLQLTGRLPEVEPDPEPPLPRGEGMVRITAGHFVAAVIIKRWRVHEAAPILRYMRGWHPDQVRDYCRAKGWRATWHPDR